MRPFAITFAAIAFLASCALPPEPAPTSADALDSAGTAVIVSRGAGFAELGAEQAAFLVASATAPGRTVDLLTPQGIIASSTYGYTVQTVPAGQYRYSGVRLGRLEATADGGEPGSGFALAPGEVVYVGDIEVRRVGGSMMNPGRPVLLIDDRSDAARAALVQQAPQIADRMQTRIVTCALCQRR